MSLFFSLNRLCAASQTLGGLEIRIYLNGYRGSAEGISLKDFSIPLGCLTDQGLKGIDLAILDAFSDANIADLKKRGRIDSPILVRIDLHSLALCFPGLAQRNWLPEHFETTADSAQAQRPVRLGSPYLERSHFYNDPDDWGYHLYLCIWFPDDPGHANYTPVRVLYITPNKDSVHDLGDFLRGSLKRYWLQEIEDLPFAVEVNDDGVVKRNSAAMRRSSSEEPVDLVDHYRRQLELRQVQIDLLSETLLEIRGGSSTSTNRDREEQTSLILALWKAFSIKPGMFGFSVDLKELVGDSLKIIEQRSELIELGLHKRPS